MTSLRTIPCLLLLAPMALTAQNAGEEFFEKKIRPVLATQCYACHSSKLKAPMGALVLDTKAGLEKVVNAGNPDQSLLLRVMRYQDLRVKMPPTGKLPDSVLDDFTQWIASGAFDPRQDTAPSKAPAASSIDYEKGRRWWSFQPVRELPAPAVSDAKWPRRKIDTFVLAALDRNGLKPSGQADPRVLVRRAWLDLVGLAPTYQETEAFARDTDPEKYEKLIDRLMASPNYGERWGRYWLDVARYAENGDTAGSRQAYPYAWRYRDWVIEAFNRDLPYDRFLKLQLAADHLPGASRKDMRALGYLGTAPSEWKEFKLGREVYETLWLDDWDERVDAFGRGILGLSVACARCHDHKFDPISAKDYYSLAGVFASTAMTIRPLFEMDPDDEVRFLYAYQRLNDLTKAAGTVEKTSLNPEADAPKVTQYRAEIARLREEMAALAGKHPGLRQALDRFLNPPAEETPPGRQKPLDSTGPFINAVYDAGLWLDGSHPDITLNEFRPGQPRDLPLFLRGNVATPGEIAPRRFLTVLSRRENEPFRRGSGRLDLAEKVVTDAAPLAARVMVNRVWGWHFGTHLVATPSDFGDRGEPPTHPELLDDLAARFIANGWSLKWLHREIMLSAAYRQSSRPRSAEMEKDPANQFLWRMNPRRLDAESYRDVLLQAAGLLNLDLGGPSVDLEAQGNFRRTVYAQVRRGGGTDDIMRMYDFPNPFQHSPKRVETITPLQQLFVMNSPFIEQAAASLAKAAGEAADPSEKVRLLYRRSLARDPSPSELDSALTYLSRAPTERLAQILLATNELIFWP